MEEVKFILPKAFSKGFIIADDSTIKEKCIQLEKRQEEIE